MRIDIHGSELRLATFRTAFQRSCDDSSEITADDVRAAADLLREYGMTRVAGALDASADDMDRPVSLESLQAGFTRGELDDAETYQRATAAVH